MTRLDFGTQDGRCCSTSLNSRKTIREYLLDALRSVEERLLFKLSLVPFGEDNQRFADALSARAGQDFEVVSLWYPHKDAGLAFCHKLWASMLAHRNIAPLSPVAALGRTLFETVAEDWAETGTAYRGRSRIGSRFKSLEAKDKTFAAFLIENGIKTDALENLPPDQRAATVRKATTIVAMRDFFMDSGPEMGKPAKLRSRKSLANVYSGAETLFAITEGNPRWFKGIMGPLIGRLEKSPK